MACRDAHIWLFSSHWKFKTKLPKIRQQKDDRQKGAVRFCKIHMVLDGRTGELHLIGKSLYSSVWWLVGSLRIQPHLMIAEPLAKPSPNPAVAMVWPGHFWRVHPRPMEWKQPLCYHNWPHLIWSFLPGLPSMLQLHQWSFDLPAEIDLCCL